MKKPIKYIVYDNEDIVKELADLRKEFKAFAEKFNPQDPDKLLTREQVCQLLNISLPTLWSWSRNKKLNAYSLGNRVYYKKSEIFDALTKINEKDE